MNEEGNLLDPEEILRSFEKELKGSLEHFKSELSKVRANRVTTATLDVIEAEVYDGQKMRLNQLGQITIEGPRTLKIEPWDKGNLKAICDAITKSDIGASPQSTGEVVRVFFPEMTQERREQMVKVVKKLLEDTKGRFRDLRNKSLKKLSSMRSSGLSEDEESFYKKKIDELLKKIEEEAENLSEAKISDIKA